MNNADEKIYKPTLAPAALTLTIAALALAACVAKSTIKENPVAAELAPMQKPVRAVNHRNYELDTLTNTEIYYDHLAATDGTTLNGRNHKGCQWQATDDVMTPTSAWANCGSNPEWQAGEHKDMVKSGEIWPLAVGNKVSYSYFQVNARGNQQPEKVTRTCEVKNTVNIDVAAGNLDTFKVVCVRKKGDWSKTWTVYYSPALAQHVKFVRQSSNNGIEHNVEYLRSEPI